MNYFRLKNRFLSALSVCLFIGLHGNASAQPAPETVPGSGDRFYVQMQKDEFLLNLIPKEKFLLYLVQGVSEEIAKRQSEGASPEDLGIADLTTPDEKKIQNYRAELRQTVNLMGEIERMERVARQRVDFKTLELLARLKERVKGILEADEITVTKPSQAKTEAVKPIGPQPEAKSAEAVQVSDIYEQWRYNRILQYKVKHTQYEFLRTRLLRTASARQEKRMFRKALLNALKRFNSGEMDVSRLALNDLLAVYGKTRVLDDVQYFAAEAAYGLNLLDEALAGYEAIEAKYPSSVYAVRGLVKRIYIQYIYSDYSTAARLYDRLLLRKTLLDKDVLGTVSYLVGHAHFRSGHYNETLKALANVQPGVNYFYPSIYLSAACYSNMGKDDLALPIYVRLINEANPKERDPVLAQIKNNALLKLGLIHYEQGDNALAIQYFDRVSSASDHYDLSLMARAWSAYKSGRPGEALKNVEAVLKSSVLSNYVYEAKVLAASSKELMGQSELAIADLKTVVQARSGNGGVEDDRVREEVADFEALQQAMLTKRNRDLFKEIERIRQFFQLSPQRESEAVSTRQFNSERSALETRVDGLDQLEAEARQRGNQAALNRIRLLRGQLIETLDNHADRFAFTPEDPLEDPLIKRLGLTEYFKYMFRALLTETLNEKKAIKSTLIQVQANADLGGGGDDFTAGLNAEIRKEELNDYYARLNQYEVWLRENAPKEVHVELDRWATFSGYGISAINFNRIKEIEDRMVHVSRVLTTMDRVYREKRLAMDGRIKNLLDDVAAIEAEMQRDSERRSRDQQERFFKTDYFDQRKQESAASKLKAKTGGKGGKK